MKGKRAGVEWEEKICKFNVWALKASNWVFMIVEEVMVFLKKLSDGIFEKVKDCIGIRRQNIVDKKDYVCSLLQILNYIWKTHKKINTKINTNKYLNVSFE